MSLAELADDMAIDGKRQLSVRPMARMTLYVALQTAIAAVLLTGMAFPSKAFRVIGALSIMRVLIM